jgi:hypothetical protein
VTTSSLRSESGQSAAELVAVVPLLIVVTLALAQLAVAGYALWTAGTAARAAARADVVGGDPREAAHSAVPSWLEHRMRIDTGYPIEVRLAATSLLPGAPAIPIAAKTTLGPEG